MSVFRRIHCDVCHAEAQEEEANGGWPGWGQLQGIALDGVPNPNLCPFCLPHVANFVDWLKRTGGDGSINEEG